jgi:ferrous iron transport protein B
VKLSELKTGEKGSIVKVLGHGGFRKRIVEMGFIKGKVVESVMNAPLNDPIKYRIMGYEVSLRRSEASLIEIVSEEDVEENSTPNEIKNSFVEEDRVRYAALRRRKHIRVALVGNPNSGKTTLFNNITGRHERVGNYTGVTVDVKEGHFTFQNYKFTLVDLPGTYSISTYSPEEKYVRNYIADQMPDVILNVVDSTNLERNLYLTTQLIDMHVSTVVALNMYDELEKNGNKLDYDLLGKLLGMPFVPTVARIGKGIDELFRKIIKVYEGADIITEEGILIDSVKGDKLLDQYHHSLEMSHKHDDEKHESDLEGIDKVHETVRHIHIYHGAEIEKGINVLKALLSKNESLIARYSGRFLAIKLLENDAEIEELVKKESNNGKIIACRDRESEQIRNILKEDTESLITDAKYGFIAGALKETWTENESKSLKTRTSKIDAILTHKIWAFPIFFLLIFVMFQATFTLGEYPMTWIEYGVAQLGELMHNLIPEGPLQALIVDGIISGVGGVIVFLPNILILYFFISLMEDTGYMARAAFIMDKVMHRMGLHGKSFIPMIMGFGCNVPAIMSTRTIENHNSRMITILVNPFMSCSARLPVYLLLVGVFFQNSGGLVLFAIYTTGILLAVLFARLFKRFLFPKEETPFVMELPPYRIPTAKSMFVHTWEKGGEYLKKMGTVILTASIFVWVLSYFPRSEQEPQTAQEMMMHQEQSYIGRVGHFIEPVIKPLGFEWRSGVALLTGVAAKEIVVSTLSVLYTGNSEEDADRLSEKLTTELKSDGSPVFTPITAIGFMLFVLIYFPCIATIAAIKNETGSWKWALFSVVYTILLAWLTAFGFYQIFG